MTRVEEITALLNLRAHPQEGGYFGETYRSEDWLPAGALPGRYGDRRSLGTAIYYLMTTEAFSALHRLATDEVFHFYLGDPVEMLQLHPDGSGRMLTLGPDLTAGMRPQIVVPRGVWQGSRLIPGGRFALLGTTMAPGFEDADYEQGVGASLIAAYPEFRERILALIR